MVRGQLQRQLAILEAELRDAEMMQQMAVDACMVKTQIDYFKSLVSYYYQHYYKSCLFISHQFSINS